MAAHPLMAFGGAFSGMAVQLGAHICIFTQVGVGGRVLEVTLHEISAQLEFRQSVPSLGFWFPP